MNEELQKDLTKFGMENQVITFTNCCGTCYMNDFDELNGNTMIGIKANQDNKEWNKGIIFFYLPLNGMNYDEDKTIIHVSWNEETYKDAISPSMGVKNMENRDLIDDYMKVLGVNQEDYKIKWPDSIHETIEVELIDGKSLFLEEEEEEECSGWNHDANTDDDEDDEDYTKYCDECGEERW